MAHTSEDRGVPGSSPGVAIRVVRESNGPRSRIFCLQVAPSTYHAAGTGRGQLALSATPSLSRSSSNLWKANYEVYGSRRLWKAARRAGIDIGRDQTRRVMGQAGIQGAHRKKRVRITRRDRSSVDTPIWSSASSSPRRQPAVGDRPDVRAHLGRRGLRLLPHRRVLADDRRLACRAADAHLDAPGFDRMARWARGHHHPDLRCHSDTGSQGSSPRSATANVSRRSVRSPLSERRRQLRL